MRVVEVPYTYHPGSVGGTEVYVQALAKHLSTRGVDVRVAAPGREAASYDHEGIPVRRYPVGSVSGPADVYGRGDAASASAFASLLDDWEPDLVHLHAHTRSVSLRHAEAARARDVPVVLTYHTPTISCARGTLLLHGDTVCDGEMRVGRCASCVLQDHGVPASVSRVAGHLPPGVGRMLGGLGLQGGAWTALRMSELMERRHQATRALLDTVDCVVAVCDWVGDVLRRNDVPPGKITVSRQGLPQDRTNVPATGSGHIPESFDPERPLRLVFFGRVDPTKGLHVLLDALQRIPDAPLRLDVYGIVHDETDYVRRVRTEADDDSRVRWRDPIPSAEVPARIGQYDALAVPSQWLETGPLVVYEAFAAGRPVLGSDLGGIAELVTDETDGLLVSPEQDPAAWAEDLLRIVTAPSHVTALRDGVRAPRTMEDAAEDMLDCYQSLLG